MRISITDRCNLRCRYCMPEDIELVSMDDILTYEEIREICEAAVELGINRFKITGGEPLVRRGCSALIKDLKMIEGTEQVTITTNGVLLEKELPGLLDAGLDAVNISLDTLDPERYKKICGRDHFSEVISGMEAALKAGLRVKVNAVLQKGINDDEWKRLSLLAKDRKLDVRFIEMMPIGFGALSKGVSNEEIYAKLQETYPDVGSDDSIHGNGPAHYVKIPGWQGSIGFISAIHGRFCDSCNRIRLEAGGDIKPCLCYGPTLSLREMMREEKDDLKRKESLLNALYDAAYHKPLQHCFEDQDNITEKKMMSGIGG